MNSPLVSVIIPVYNVENYLNRCVESVVNQTYRNLEIILVDDGSPDKCPQMCDKWAEKDNRIRVIHKENGGLSSARNAGLDMCRGEYVSFVDSDDWVELDFYETIVLQMMEYCAEIGCAGRYDVDYETLVRKKGLCPDSKCIIMPELMIGKILTWRECDSSCCDKVFLVSLWDDIRFPEGRISEDVAVVYKIVDRASGVLLLDKPLYNYFHRQGSITTSVYSSKTLYVVSLSDEICDYVAEFHPGIMSEAKYFKFKTLLHWNRAFMVQDSPPQDEKEMYSSSRKWLIKQFFFVLFSCKYISMKDKIWYILIVLGMKRIVRKQLKK